MAKIVTGAEIDVQITGQESVKELNIKLERAKQNLTDIGIAYGENSTQYADAAKKLQTLEGAYDNVNREVKELGDNNLKKATNETKNLKNGFDAMGNAGQVFEQAGGNVGKLRDALGGAASNSTILNRKTRDLSETIEEQKSVLREFQRELYRLEQAKKASLTTNFAAQTFYKNKIENIKDAIHDQRIALQDLGIQQKKYNEDVKNSNKVIYDLNRLSGGMINKIISAKNTFMAFAGMAKTGVSGLSKSIKSQLVTSFKGLQG